MRHLKHGRKLKRTASHRRALLNNLATALLQHKKIQTTEAKAKELRPFVERLITKAKRALVKEQNGSLPQGQTVDVHARRIIGRYVKSKAVAQELFDAIAPAVENRPGGYVRIVKTGTRHGDGGRTAMIELVDWAESKDGRAALRRKKKKATPKKEKKSAATATQERLEEQVATSVAQAVEMIASHTETTAEVSATAESEAPQTDAPAPETESKNAE